ncbi:hypothetical protein HK100_001683 [Physocladia obscura]|uniref:Kinesin motor domain-containing protein n=1 Tax=Physocladia obscura TaxID=109957 RepID=A0AAD5SWR9_9FUNG|nr:hypothetical protein HK100_001683 [Physocladia obscura]
MATLDQSMLSKAMAQKAAFERTIAAHQKQLALETATGSESEGVDDAEGVDADRRVTVHFRTRPLSAAERKHGLFKVLFCDATYGHATLYYPAFRVLTDNTLDVQRFRFDAAFDADADNAHVYEATVRPKLPALFAHSGLLTVMAYGQTGSGKTFTMASIAQLLVDDLPIVDGQSKISVSVLEIQGDVIRDLSADADHSNQQQPKVLLDAKGLPVLTNVRELPASSKQDVLDYFRQGFESRTTRATAKNRESSRSHFICSIRLANPDQENGTGVEIKLVDLAGSEAGNDKKEHDAATLKESVAINKSLSALKECIRKSSGAATTTDGHIPFRNSKLTMVLKEALDPFAKRHTRTAIFALAAPTVADIPHTFNTYRYALALTALGSTAATPAAALAAEQNSTPQTQTKPATASTTASTTPMAWSRLKLERWIETQFQNEVTLTMLLGPKGDPKQYGRPQTDFVLPPWKFIYEMSLEQWTQNASLYGKYSDAENVGKVRERYKRLFLVERVVKDGGIVADGGGVGVGAAGRGIVLMLKEEETKADNGEPKKSRAEIAMEKAKAKGAAIRAAGKK